MASPDLSNLRKFVAPEFVFGPGSSHLAGQFASNYSLRKVLLVTGPHLIHLPWPRQVMDSLDEQGVAYSVFTDVSPNPRDHQVMLGAEAFRGEGCEGIVAVGGGSPMDLAKALGVVVTNDRHVLEFEGLDNVDHPGPPLICVPTTAGTAADISQFSIINDTDRQVKIAIVSKTMVPDAALIDPLTTTTMDSTLTANTGLDALTHAFEAYVSNASSPVTDLHALEAVRLVREHLLHAVADPEDMDARNGMMLASTYAGLAFSNAILGAVHAMAHSLGGLLDMPHGLCNAILLDHVVAFNYDSAPEKYVRLGQALGAVITDQTPHAQAREQLLETLRTLKTRAGISQTLGDLGMTGQELPQLTRNALNDPCMLTNPRQPTPEDLISIYENAS